MSTADRSRAHNVLGVYEADVDDMSSSRTSTRSWKCVRDEGSGLVPKRYEEREAIEAMTPGRVERRRKIQRQKDRNEWRLMYFREGLLMKVSL